MKPSRKSKLSLRIFDSVEPLTRAIKFAESIYVLLLVHVSLFAVIHPAACVAQEFRSPPSIRLPVFYATDRQSVTSNKELAGQVLNPMSLGSASVWLPSESKWLDAGSCDLKPELQHLGWSLSESKRAMKPYIEVRGYVAETETDQVIENISSNSDFWERLSKQTEFGKNIYVYIHGFAASGHNALYAGGVLSAHLQSPVVVFTWPSQGTVGLEPLTVFGDKRVRARFAADKAMIDNPQVLRDLTCFLKALRDHLGPDCKISILAHSLGNRLLAKYLAAQKDLISFEGVYFLAADVDEKLFRSILPGLRERSKYTAVYKNRDDRVLKISWANDLLELKLTKKLGKDNYSLPHIDFVDYREIAQPRVARYLDLRHYVPFEDLGEIIRKGTPEDSSLFVVRNSSIRRAKR